MIRSPSNKLQQHFSQNKRKTMWNRTLKRFHVVPHWSDVAPGWHHQKLGFRDCKKANTMNSYNTYECFIDAILDGYWWVSTYFIVSACFTMTPFWSTWSEIFLDKCCTSDTCSTWRVKLRSWLKCWMILKDSPHPKNNVSEISNIYLPNIKKNSIASRIYHIVFRYTIYNTTNLKCNIHHIILNI